MTGAKIQFGVNAELVKPSHISVDPIASEYWDWVTDVLADVLCLSDAAGVAMLCEAYSDYRASRDERKAVGAKHEQYHNRYYRLLKAHGLTPESRKNVPQPEKEEVDPLIQLQQRREAS